MNRANTDVNQGQYSFGSVQLGPSKQQVLWVPLQKLNFVGNKFTQKEKTERIYRILSEIYQFAWKKSNFEEKTNTAVTNEETSQERVS